MDTTQQSKELILLFEKFFSSHDPTSRKEAEIQLNMYANQKNELFFALISELIISKNLKGFFILLHFLKYLIIFSLEEMKDSAIIYLNYFIKQKINTLENSDSWFIKTANFIFGFLKEDKISIKHKQNLKNAFISLLSKDLSNIIIKNYFNKNILFDF